MLNKGNVKDLESAFDYLYEKVISELNIPMDKGEKNYIFKRFKKMNDLTDNNWESVTVDSSLYKKRIIEITNNFKNENIKWMVEYYF